MNIAQPVAFAQAVASGDDAGVATIVAVVTALLGLLAGVGIVVRALLGLAGDDGDDAGDDGGGGPGRRRPLPRRPPPAPPDWWPEFEREFADHVRADSRKRGIETRAR